MVPWLGVSDQTSSGVLYTLQRSNSYSGKACKYSVAIVKSAEHECHDQTLGDCFTSKATDLTHSPQLKKATAENTTDVLLHRELIVKVDAEISYNRDRLDDVITD